MGSVWAAASGAAGSQRTGKTARTSCDLRTQTLQMACRGATQTTNTEEATALCPAVHLSHTLPAVVGEGVSGTGFGDHSQARPMRLALPTGRGRWRLNISDCRLWPVAHLLTGGVTGAVLVHHVVVVIAQPQLHRCEARPALHPGEGRQALAVRRPVTGRPQRALGSAHGPLLEPSPRARGSQHVPLPAPAPSPCTQCQAHPGLRSPVCTRQTQVLIPPTDGEVCTGSPDPLTQDVANQPCLGDIIGPHAAGTPLRLTGNRVKKKMTTVRPPLPTPQLDGSCAVDKGLIKTQSLSGRSGDAGLAIILAQQRLPLVAGQVP